MPYFVFVTLLRKELACGDDMTLGGKEEKDYSDDKNDISDMEVAS
jgi:hypothetical protein